MNEDGTEGLADGAAGMAPGAALHYAVERPFLRWRERLDARRSGGPFTPLPATS